MRFGIAYVVAAIAIAAMIAINVALPTWLNIVISAGLGVVYLGTVVVVMQEVEARR